MAVNLTNPTGSTSSSKFNVINNVVVWDAFNTIPIDPTTGAANAGVLSTDHLTARAQGGGVGQGAATAVKWGLASGKVYWEAKWKFLTDNSLPCGVGLIDTDAFLGLQDQAQLSLVYNDHATNAKWGIIFRPDGTAYEIVPNGNGVGPENPPWPLFWSSVDGINPTPCNQGDTIGMLIDFDFGGGFVAIATILMDAGGALVRSSGNFFPPLGGTYIPCVMYDSATLFDSMSVTANFGANPSTLLGPKIASGTLAGYTLGWPTTQ